MAEVVRVLDGYYSCRSRQVEEVSALNHQLANLIAFAYHKPDKIPKFGDGEQSGRREDLEDLQVRATLKAMAGAA